MSTHHGGPARELGEIDGLMQKAERLLGYGDEDSTVAETVTAGVGYALLALARLVKIHVESEEAA